MKKLVDLCPQGAFLQGQGTGIGFGDHSGFDGLYTENVSGRGIVMLRQPEQRIISAWNDNYHSWPYYYYNRFPSNLQEYAKAVSGCAVKMITRDTVSAFHGFGGSACGGEPDRPVTSEDTALAIH